MGSRQIEFPCGVLSLRIAFYKGQWTLEHVGKVKRRTLPKPHELPSNPRYGSLAGFWWDVVDSQGQVIYRRIIDDPMRQALEVFHADRSISRRMVDKEQAAFEALIPAVPGIDKLRIFSSILGESQKEGRDAETKIRPTTVLKIPKIEAV